MTPIKHHIPKFKTLEEEAEFWNTHDTADFEDEFKPVQVHFAKNLSDTGVSKVKGIESCGGGWDTWEKHACRVDDDSRQKQKA